MEEGRRYVLIGTAGHIDHGKTALVKMLTGCETDTLREEKERGLTIELGFAPCELRGDLMGCIVDVPGHEKFIKNMVAGASGIDAVLLVVAADDSVMPQTVEHLRIVELLGIDRGLVAVTKIDMVDEELRELVVEEVSEFLEGTFLEGAPICPVSSVTGEGMEQLWLALTEVVESCRDRPVHGIFRMPVERVFSPAGYGTVMTGMPPSGQVRVGETLELLPQGDRGRVRGMQVYGKDADEGWAGQCLALNLADVNHNDVLRGHVVAAPGYVTPQPMAEVRLELLAGAERPLRHQAPVRFHTGTAEVMGRMFFLDRENLEPGGSALAQFRAEEPLLVAPGDRFVIRQYSPVVTIGGGRILRSGRRKVKRFREGVIRELTSLEEVLDDERELLAWHLERSGRTPARRDDLLRRAYLPRERLAELMEELVAEGRARSLGKEGPWVSAGAVAGVMDEVRAAVAGYHREHPLRLGIDAPALRAAVVAEGPLLETAVEELVAAGEVERREGLLGGAGHEAAPSDSQAALAARVGEILEGAGVQPLEVARLAEEVGAGVDELRAILGYLVDRGDAVRVTGDLFLSAAAEARAERLLVDYLREHERIGVVDYRDLIGASRKYVYAILDHFDGKGVTYRAGNFRYLRERGRREEV